MSPGGFDDWEVELSEGFLPRETEDPRQHGTGNETSGVSKARSASHYGQTLNFKFQNFYYDAIYLCPLQLF